MRIPKIAVVLILLCAIENGYSQGIEVELLFRPALTSLYGNDLVKRYFDPTVNLSAGAGVNFLVGRNSLINIAFLYDRKGAQKEMEFLMRDSNNEIVGKETLTNVSNFQYITVPVQLARRFGNKIKYQIGLGVYGSYLLKQESGAKNLSYTDDVIEDTTDMYKKFDVGISSAFSVYMPLSNAFYFKAGIDDHFGLLNTSDVDGGEIKHNSIGLIVGLNYSFGKSVAEN